ncbi:CDP-alcohol phosphatidyltransferase family protein [Legionella geestiana]|nr:CDP-alcohol phosphatidyltransferase family protein [Legionella geestiana]QBS12526.1 CDP-alcohol phosphatidyltransferase family protein [Legionella geestiana]QDQ39758.1 CDP-alcohol phosphatidyltransferase family protein [Legionella geestiana]
MKARYIPNALTLFRLCLIVPFLVFLHQGAYTHALYTFLLAGVTDALDGWLARHFGWQTLFGSFADPLADKLLVASSFISLALLGTLPWWLVALVFLRDLTISLGVLGWYYFIRIRLHFAPTRLSKINTTVQLMLVLAALLKLSGLQFSDSLMTTLVFLTTLTTGATYIDYVWTWGRKALRAKCPAQ